MKVLPILSLLLFSSALYSQSEPEKWIHAYLDFGYEERHLSPYTNGGSTYTNEHFELGFRNIAPGYFKLEEKGIYREFSLTRLQFEEEDDVNYVTMPPFIVNSPRDGERTYTSGIGFQIESGLMPKKWFGGFFRPGIGLGAVPEVAYFRNIPKVSNRYPYREFSIGLGVNIVPRLHFRITERVAVVLAVPIYIGGAEWSSTKMENPILTKEQQTTNLFAFEIDPGVEFGRLGAAIKL